MFFYSWIVGSAFPRPHPAPMYAPAHALLREAAEADVRRAQRRPSAATPPSRSTRSRAWRPSRRPARRKGCAGLIQAEFASPSAHKVFKGDFVSRCPMTRLRSSSPASSSSSAPPVDRGAARDRVWPPALGEVVAINSLVLLANGPILHAAGVLGSAAGGQRAAHAPAGRPRSGARESRRTGPACARSSRSRDGSTLRKVGLRYLGGAGPSAPLEDVTLELEPGIVAGARRPVGVQQGSLLQAASRA